MTDVARKAVATAVTGMSTWSATYLPGWAGGLVAVGAATFMCWLVPNGQLPGVLRREAGSAVFPVVVAVFAGGILLWAWGVF